MTAIGGATMGTSWSVRAVAPRAMLDALLPDIKALFAALIAEMSQWEPNSHLSRFNAAPGAAWHVLPPAFFEVLTAALDVARASGGAFDPTIGALVDRWGFGAVPRDGPPPTDAEVELLHLAAGWDKLTLDLPAQRVFRPGGIRLDFSGIAKGYAVDRLAALLRAKGIRNFLAEIGGELVGAGIKPDGEPWWVDAELPPGAALPPLRIALHGLAIATSGDYRRFFEWKGRSYGHTLDPRTGAPLANDVAAVTVLHQSCMMADAYATAIGVMGPQAGMSFADSRDIACQMVVRRDGGFAEVTSRALAAMLD